MHTDSHNEKPLLKPPHTVWIYCYTAPITSVLIVTQTGCFQRKGGRNQKSKSNFEEQLDTHTQMHLPV